LIGCELLSDVHKICSLPGDGEDLSLLRKHFLQGRGWRSLATLHCLGVRVMYLLGSEIYVHIKRNLIFIIYVHLQMILAKKLMFILTKLIIYCDCT